MTGFVEKLLNFVKSAFKKLLSHKNMRNLTNFNHNTLICVKTIPFFDKQCYNIRNYSVKRYEFNEDVCNSMSAIEVANYLLSKESMTHKKLQKLCYYCQGWHLALFNEELFEDQIEAWIHGPVVASLYPIYADYGWKEIPKTNCQNYNLNKNQIETIDAVWDAYGKYSGDELEALSHSEPPWKTARGLLKPYEPSNNIIDRNLMEPYFKMLFRESQDA